MTILADRYRLGAVLGSGGVADVYRARDLVLDRDVAVKVLREHVDDTDRSRFVGEARLLAGLSHEGLVTVLDAGVSGTQPFLVMELVEGSTLAAVLRDGPLPPAQVAEIGVQLASALAYAHEQDVVHRDVKPANVLITEGGSAKLADFGIARLVGDTMRHTQTGTTIGTPAFVSPEQARGAQVGPPSDVYSLGLVLLEALTGERAFTGTPVESALARLHRPPHVPDDLPSPWPGLLAAMTATDPGDRPSAAEAAARMRAPAAPDATRVLTSPAAAAAPAAAAGAGADEVPTEHMRPAPAATWSRRAPALAVLAGAAVVLLVVVAVAAALLGGGDTSENGPGDVPTPASTASTGQRTDASTATGTPPASTTPPVVTPPVVTPPGKGKHAGGKGGKNKGAKGPKDKGGKGGGKKH